ncbi:variable surface protein Vir15, putative [Plasmodium vivax]|uniref:Variable surface protein Vir15, putative n=1 Tax=Plasmodium vivax (strain Salvador I) TaxID=126793 RepID=A5KD01_PLAVS|nr:variable surface protein Vir15, putative [Plasmodium vivax]EDL42767.1 variable surface protein Vir15, putative [Plasmodium vivax]|eukprot:XP_001612560.1 variable surface protein Vir15 [Plasmodium vivax Sal-1]
MYHTYKGILDTWVPNSDNQPPDDCIAFKQELIQEHNNIFKNMHCSQAKHYLNNVERIRNPNNISNACKYFLYWLYIIVLKKDLEKHKILKIYKDVLTAYIDESGNENFRNYVNFFSEETIKKIIKLTEMYDYFYKFKEEQISHENVKCNHAENCIRLYNENIKVCEEGNDYDFCYELDNLKESYDTYMKSYEGCRNLPKTLESYRLYNPATVIITPFSILLVMSLSLFFLYKFTPFGSFFRKRRKNKKKIPDNLDYETHFPPHTSQRVNNYNNNRQYNISYLSSGQ